MLEKRASNSDEIEFNRVVTGTVDNPSNAATTNSSLTPNDQQAPLIKPTFITSVGDAANTKRPIEILTSPNTDVALLDKDGATMGTEEQMKLVMSLLFHNNGFLKVMFQRKPHVVQKA